MVAQAGLGALPPGDVAGVEGVGEFQGKVAPQGQGTVVTQAEAQFPGRRRQGEAVACVQPIALPSAPNGIAQDASAGFGAQGLA